jgi:hypothetical protein
MLSVDENDSREVTEEMEICMQKTAWERHWREEMCLGREESRMQQRNGLNRDAVAERPPLTPQAP